MQCCSCGYTYGSSFSVLYDRPNGILNRLPTLDVVLLYVGPTYLLHGASITYKGRRTLLRASLTTTMYMMHCIVGVCGAE